MLWGYRKILPDTHVKSLGDINDENPNVATAGIVYHRAWLFINRRKYSYPYDVMKDSDIYTETGTCIRGATQIHYFELSDNYRKEDY